MFLLFLKTRRNSLPCFRATRSLAILLGWFVCRSHARASERQAGESFKSPPPPPSLPSILEDFQGCFGEAHTEAGGNPRPPRGDPLKRKRNLLSPDPNPKLNAADKQIDIKESEQVYYAWI